MKECKIIKELLGNFEFIQIRNKLNRTVNINFADVVNISLRPKQVYLVKIEKGQVESFKLFYRNMLDFKTYNKNSKVILFNNKKYNMNILLEDGQSVVIEANEKIIVDGLIDKNFYRRLGLIVLNYTEPKNKEENKEDTEKENKEEVKEESVKENKEDTEKENKEEVKVRKTKSRNKNKSK